MTLSQHQAMRSMLAPDLAREYVKKAVRAAFADCPEFDCDCPLHKSMNWDMYRRLHEYDNPVYMKDLLVWMTILVGE